jgi:hypothetical protein
MPSLDSFGFDPAGLAPQGDDGNARSWLTSDGDPVTLYYFAKPSPMSASPANLDAWRARVRSSVGESGGALVEIEPLDFGGCTAIREIVKVPQTPFGMGYLGSLVLPFRDFGFMFTIAAPERGVTGQRDTLVLGELIQQGEVRFEDGAEQPIGWMADPYDPTVKTPPGRNRSDDAAYDARFPNHPLSRVRHLLRRVVITSWLTDVAGETTEW